MGAAFLVFLATSKQGSMFGLDHLGIAKYGRLAAAEHPAGFALGAFSNTFGDALPSIKLVLDAGRCPRVRIHLYWSDNAGHKPDRDYLRRIQREAQRVGAFLKPYVGRVDCRVSGYCEHPLKVREAKAVRDLVMRYMPAGVTYVNSLWSGGGGQALPGEVNEIHGSKERPLSGRYEWSYDGQSCFDSDVEADKKKFARAETFYLWFPQCNGRKTLTDSTPRPQRKAFPTSRYIDSAIYLSTSSGVGTKLPKGYIFKSHADQHTVPPEPRAGKPVLIMPVSKAKIELTTKSGQVVGAFTYAGSFTGGGYRYYCSDWGYLIAEKAKRISGSNVCQLRVNGRAVANVNPAFRAGSFR
jgi:hypothetical protein